MLSMPPATTISESPVWIPWAARATAFKPDPQTLLMVSAATSGRRPPPSAACRAGFCPSPADTTLPMMTSSTLDGARPARSHAARMTRLPSCGAVKGFNVPWNFPMGVRTALRITGCFIGASARWGRGSGSIKMEIDLDLDWNGDCLAVVSAWIALPLIQYLFRLVVQSVSKTLQDLVWFHRSILLDGNRKKHDALNPRLARIVGVVGFDLNRADRIRDSGRSGANDGQIAIPRSSAASGSARANLISNARALPIPNAAITSWSGRRRAFHSMWIAERNQIADPRNVGDYGLDDGGHRYQLRSHIDDDRSPRNKLPVGRSG